MNPDKQQFPNPHVSKEELKKYGVTEEEYHEVMRNQPETEWTQEELEKYYQETLKKEKSNEAKRTPV